MFFDRNRSTTDIFYYEVNPSYKLTKNKPILFEYFKDFLECSKNKKINENSWIVNVADIKDNNKGIYDLMDEIELILNEKEIA